MIPTDLNDMAGSLVKEKLFAEPPGGPSWWSLDRETTNAFRWKDERLRIEFSASHGFLVALHEVSTFDQAREFGRKNKISLVEGRGLAWRGSAEIAIRCGGLTPRDELLPTDALFQLDFINGVVGTVGYASTLFERLIARPAAELNVSLADPRVLTTLVITNVDKADVTGAAELCLFRLREKFPLRRFEFATLERPLPDIDDLVEQEEPASIRDLPSTQQPWAVAFFNRASESENIAAFLYLYRVLEACFDHVIDAQVSEWRADAGLDVVQLVQKIRRFTQKEDVWALRRVIQEVATQSQIDRAFEGGLITTASGDGLAQGIYLRRNEIAHGRRGQHDKVLVPYGFQVESALQRDILWTELMRELASECMNRWIMEA